MATPGRPLGADDAVAGGQGHRQPVEEGGLGLDELAPGLGRGEPGGPVDLGKGPGQTRAGRPLHLEGVAPGGGDVEITGQRPGPDDLAALLGDLTQVDAVPARRRGTELLGELPLGRGLGVVVPVHLALRDRPDAVILPTPQGSAGVGQEDLEDEVGVEPVEQEAGAQFGHLPQLHLRGAPPVRRDRVASRAPGGRAQGVPVRALLVNLDGGEHAVRGVGARMMAVPVLS